MDHDGGDGTCHELQVVGGDQSETVLNPVPVLAGCECVWVGGLMGWNL
jgi:hypothetical protein